jgi:peptidoglycan/xylan/chitin deacetylase (PgdA/CDA1 family)
MNAYLKSCVASNLDRLGLLHALRYMRSAKRGIILTFHRILRDADKDTSYDPHLVMSESVFDELLFLLRKEFEVVDLEQLVLQPEGQNRRQRLAITFDDGWKETYSVAFPLLLRYQIPATLFLCTRLLSETDSFSMLPEERFARIWKHCSLIDRLTSLLEDFRIWGVSLPGKSTKQAWSIQLKQLCLRSKLLLLTYLEDTYQPPRPVTRHFISWEEARIMASNNVTIGSHTAGHCTLSSEQDATIIDELSHSRAEILERVGTNAQFLAYPNGAYNSHAILIAREVGFTHAFTTETGLVSRKTNSYTIPRIAMEDSLVVTSQLALNASRTRFHLQALQRHILPLGRHFD